MKPFLFMRTNTCRICSVSLHLCWQNVIYWFSPSMGNLCCMQSLLAKIIWPLEQQRIPVCISHWMAGKDNRLLISYKFENQNIIYGRLILLKIDGMTKIELNLYVAHEEPTHLKLYPLNQINRSVTNTMTSLLLCSNVCLRILSPSMAILNLF